MTLPFQISQRRTALCRGKLVWSIWVIPCLGASMGWQLMMVCVPSFKLIPTEGMVVRWWCSISHFGGICYFEGFTLLSQKPDLKENTLPEMENPMMSVSSPCSKLQAPRPFPQVMVGFLLGKTLKKIGIRLARLLSSERNTFQKVLPVWNTHSFDMQTEASRNDTSYQKIKPPCPIPLNPSCLIMEFSSLAIRILYDKG